jgi:hypothetical protein
MYLFPGHLIRRGAPRHHRTQGFESARRRCVALWDGVNDSPRASRDCRRCLIGGTLWSSSRCREFHRSVSHAGLSTGTSISKCQPATPRTAPVKGSPRRTLRSARQSRRPSPTAVARVPGPSDLPRAAPHPTLMEATKDDRPDTSDQRQSHARPPGYAAAMSPL